MEGIRVILLEFILSVPASCRAQIQSLPPLVMAAESTDRALLMPPNAEAAAAGGDDGDSGGVGSKKKAGIWKKMARRVPIRSDAEADKNEFWKYALALGGSLALLLPFRSLVPEEHKAWVYITFAAFWGLGSAGFVMAVYGGTCVERFCSRHLAHLSFMWFTMLGFYMIYLMGSKTLTGFLGAIYIGIAILALVAQIRSWILTCSHGNDTSDFVAVSAREEGDSI